MPENALIEVDDLTIGYIGRPVLDEVKLTVDRAEILAVVGPSGSGKSTLLRCMAGLMPPSHGRVRVFGQELYTLSAGELQALRMRTGMLFQQDALLGSLTVSENVRLPLQELTALPRSVVDELVATRLAMVGLDALRDRTPDELSGGQRRRAAIARASIMDPDLLFCDEPTSGLDPIAAAQIERILQELRAILGTAVVIVTHELATVRAIADRVVMLYRGRVITAGSLTDLESQNIPELEGFFDRRIPQSRSLPSDLLERLSGGQP